MAAAGLLNTNEAVSHGVLLGPLPPAAPVSAPAKDEAEAEARVLR